MMKYILFISSCCLLSCICHSQALPDSLQKALQHQPKDTIYAGAVLKAAKWYNSTNPDSSLLYTSRFFELPATSQTSSLTVQAYLLTGYANYIKGDYPSSLKAYQRMYTSAEKIKDTKNMSIAINNQGNVYIELNELNKATERYQASLAIASASGNDYGVARSYNNIGYVYKESGVYDKATENFLFALSYYEKLSMLNETSICYNNIAAVYIRQKNFTKALEYNNTALAIQKKNNLLIGWGISLQSIANIYAETKEYSAAVPYYQQAFGIYEKMKDSRQLAILYSNLAEMYNLQQNYDSSVYYYDKAIALNKAIGNKRNLAINYIGNAASLISKNDLPKASLMLDSAEVLTANNNRREDVKNFLMVKSDYYNASGNSMSALEYYKRYVGEKDSLVNEENLKTVADLNIKYETEKKKLQIELLNKEASIKDLEIKSQRLALTKRAYELAKQQLQLSNANLLISNNDLKIKNQQQTILQNRLDSVEAARQYTSLRQQSSIQQLELQNQKLLNERKTTVIVVLLGLSFLIALLSYSYYRRYQLKQEARRQADILQQQELASKAILDAEERERERIARDLHDGVGQMMSAARMNLSAVESDLISLDVNHQSGLQTVISLLDNSLKEVRAVSHSMMPNALLKAGLAGAVREFIDQVDKRRLSIQLHTEGLHHRIDITTESMLYRVIQECINNVIRHAGATQLDISLIKDDSSVSATIEDNGRGFVVKDAEQKDGIGFKNIRSRIEFLKGEVEWNSQPQQGTLVAFHVPL